MIDHLLERLAPADEIRVVVRPAKRRPDRAPARARDAGRGRAADGRRVARARARGPGGGRRRPGRLPGHALRARARSSSGCWLRLATTRSRSEPSRFAEPSRSDVLELDGDRGHAGARAAAAARLEPGLGLLRREPPRARRASRRHDEPGVLSTSSPEAGGVVGRSTSTRELHGHRHPARPWRPRDEGPRHRPPRLHRLGRRAVPRRAGPRGRPASTRSSTAAAT